jgi:hypothetical protein
MTKRASDSIAETNLLFENAAIMPLSVEERRAFSFFHNEYSSLKKAGVKVRRSRIRLETLALFER